MAALMTAGAWLARRFAAWGLTGLLSLSFLGPAGAIFTGIANAIGAAITAISEIVTSLAKSAEGRVLLGLVSVTLSFLYLRFHYTEQGRSESAAKIAELHRTCHAQLAQKHKR